MMLLLCQLNTEKKGAVQRSSFLLLSYLGYVQGTESYEAETVPSGWGLCSSLSVCLPFLITTADCLILLFRLGDMIKKKKKALLVWSVINCSFKILSTEFSYVKLKCWIIMQFISAYNWKFVQYWYCVYMNKSFRSWFDDMKPYDDMMIWFDDGVMIWFDMNKSFR